MFLLHAWWSIGLFALALYAAAAGAFFFLRWPRVAFVLAAVATAHVYSGVIYQAGIRECQARVQQEVAAEQTRQQGIAEQAVNELNAKLAVVEGLTAADRQRIADYEAELAKAPANNACTLNDADVRAINGR